MPFIDQAHQRQIDERHRHWLVVRKSNTLSALSVLSPLRVAKATWAMTFTS